MKSVRIVVLVTIVLTLAATASAEVKGWGLGVGILDGDFGIQVRKDFWLGGDISQITGGASVYFHSRTTFRFDVDYHFIINPGNPSRFYPLVGLQLAFNSDAVKFGVNGGVGVNFKLTESLAAFGEAKYVFGKWDGWAFTAGIYI
jgi:opacity protein-like surface antigen